MYLSRGFVRRNDLVAGVNDHPRRILISEEDILGMSTDLLDGLYPRAVRRLEPWAAVMGRARPHIFLSIRNYADILPSAYSQALRDGAIPHAMTEYRAHWLGRKPNWIELINAVKAAFGEPAITVWSFDVYRHSPAAVRKAVTGLELPGELETAPGGTMRLSATAVDRIERLGPLRGHAARLQAIREILTRDQGSAPLRSVASGREAISHRTLSTGHRGDQADASRVSGLDVERLHPVTCQRGCTAGARHRRHA